MVGDATSGWIVDASDFTKEQREGARGCTLDKVLAVNP